MNDFAFALVIDRRNPEAVTNLLVYGFGLSWEERSDEMNACRQSGRNARLNQQGNPYEL